MTNNLGISINHSLKITIPKGDENEKIRYIEDYPLSHVYNYLPLELSNKLSMELVKSKPINPLCLSSFIFQISEVPSVR